MKHLSDFTELPGQPARRGGGRVKTMALPRRALCATAAGTLLGLAAVMCVDLARIKVSLGNGSELQDVEVSTHEVRVIHRARARVIARPSLFPTGAGCVGNSGAR